MRKPIIKTLRRVPILMLLLSSLGICSASHGALNARFSADKTQIETGTQVRFTDQSTG